MDVCMDVCMDGCIDGWMLFGNVFDLVSCPSILTSYLMLCCMHQLDSI